MARKTTPSTREEKAYVRGYTAGRNRSKKTDEAVIKALKSQVEYWRERYIRLRDGEPTPAVDAVGEAVE